MAQVLRVVIGEATFRVSLPPPNGDKGYWEYEIVTCVEQKKRVAKVSHMITGMQSMKPVGCFPVDRVSAKTMIALAEQVASQTPLSPPKGKGRPKTQKASLRLTCFEVELDGICDDGMPRICDVIIQHGRMDHAVQQPDGRWFSAPCPEPLTATVRRKTKAGKGRWHEVPVSKHCPEEAGRASLAVADQISWAAARSKPPPTNTMPCYSEPPCTGCGNGIGKQASCFRFAGDPTVQLYCLRCMGKVWGNNVPRDESILPTRHMMKGHLPTHTTPPTPCSDESICGKCGKAIKERYYRCGWIPTNQMFVFCPGCWSKATLHDGWRAQLDLD